MKIEVNKWKKLGLTLSLVVVLNVFFNVGVATFYKYPSWEAFCPQIMYSDVADTREACETAGGLWREDSYYEKGATDSGYCEVPYSCSQKYNDTFSVYNRNVFIVLTVLGAATLVSGIMLALPSAVANGLLYGGVISMLIGTMRFWTEMDDYLRFIVSGIVLAVLIGLGVKKMKD